MILISEFIDSHKLGDPKDPQLSARIVRELRRRGFKQRVRNKRRVWLSPEELGASDQKIQEALDSMKI